MKKLCQLAVIVCFLCPLFCARAELIVVLMSDKTLRHIDPDINGAGIFTKTINLTGIPAAETPVALDFMTEGSLVLVTAEGNLLRTYFVDPTTGAATSANFARSVDSANAVAFDASSKTATSHDLLLTTEADELERFRLKPFGPSVLFSPTLVYDNSTTDGDRADERAGFNPSIVALGSTNGFDGARATVVYGIDSTQNSLVKIDRETGVLDTIATLRTETDGTLLVGTRTGLEISGITAVAYIMFGSGDTSSLLTLDLTTGKTRVLGQSIGPPSQPGGAVALDIATLPPSQLANLSTRSRVGTGEDVMIAGFILQGSASSRLFIRGIGPSLAAFGINDALPDPVLKIFDGNGVQIAFNDNWKSDQESLIRNTAIPPSNDLEAAFLGTFPPGQYTAIVSDKNGGTGVGLVEVFKLSP